jgi:hypothetical protein
LRGENEQVNEPRFAVTEFHLVTSVIILLREGSECGLDRVF